MRTLAALVLLAAPALAAAPSITFQQYADRVEVLADGKPLTALYFGPETTKPYLHPLRAADGTIVTRQYPMRSDVPGEAHDHPHHRGLWFSHGDVNGYDFWANELDQQPRDKKGKIVLKGVHKADDGFIRADFEWRSPEGEVLLTDERIYRFAVQGKVVLVDVELSLKAEVKPVKFGDTKEGTFAIRLHHEMQETTPDKKPGKGAMVSSTGLRGENQVWGKAAPWVDYSGPIGGKSYGIAIFDHPSNPKHPTHWHARAYGLFAANIFGERDFYNDKSRDGSVTLRPGERMNFRYRVAIHQGAKPAEVDKLYKAFAANAAARPASSAASAPSAADAALEIHTAERGWAKAVLDKDYAALERIYDEDLIYAHSTGIVETKGEYLGKLRSGSQVYTAIDFESSTVRAHGDAAVAHHIVVMKGTNASGPFDNKLMMIHTWFKKGGQWRLVAHQTTLLPR